MAPATDIAWGCIKEKPESTLIIPRTAAKVFVSGACGMCDVVCKTAACLPAAWNRAI